MEQNSLEQLTTSLSKETFNMKSVIQDVIDGKFDIFNVKTMADYDADFRGEEPYFINIWNKEEGFGFGYIVFHDFLRRVGVGKTFTSTNFTEGGTILFQKAVTDGLIEKTSEKSGLQQFTRWKVIGDPITHLTKMKESIK